MTDPTSVDHASHLPDSVLPPTHYRHQLPPVAQLPPVQHVAGDDKLFVGRVDFPDLGGVLLVVKTPDSVSTTFAPKHA